MDQMYVDYFYIRNIILKSKKKSVVKKSLYKEGR